MNKITPNYKFFTFLIIALVIVSSCSDYRIIREKGCLVGLHDQTMTYKLKLLKDSIETSSYLQLKKVVFESGFEWVNTADDENDFASFSEKNSPYKITLQINRLSKTAFILRFEEGCVANEPAKSEFISYCNKSFAALRTKYFNVQ